MTSDEVSFQQRPVKHQKISHLSPHVPTIISSLISHPRTATSLKSIDVILIRYLCKVNRKGRCITSRVDGTRRNVEKCRRINNFKVIDDFLFRLKKLNFFAFESSYHIVCKQWFTL